SIKDITKFNFHDAKVTEVVVENDELIFVIPNGLNNDIEDQNIRSCKLKFKLVFENEAKMTYSKYLHPKFIRRLHKDVYYKTREFLSLTDLAKLTDKKNGFEILNWNFSDTMDYINFDCVVNGIEPLRIELDVLSAEILIEDN
ncbi:MAG: hypothetical protein K2M95_03435, partial [Clostridiales bacterium]|nr:hypothetical protein [Clostridiales bacterium]